MMTSLRHLGKTLGWRPIHAPKTRKTQLGVWGFFCLGFFVLKRSLWTLFLGPFPRAKTTYKLLWNSKNVTNIIKALNVRENIKEKRYLDLTGKFVSVGKMTFNGICVSWLNPCNFIKNEIPTHQAYFCQLWEILQPAILSKTRLWHRCFLVNFTKYLRRLNL